MSFRRLGEGGGYTHSCASRYVKWVQLQSFRLLAHLVFKVPLTCKIFISLKESVLLVKKIRGSFKCIWSLHWGEIEGQSFKNVLLFNR